jgi:uncharacterized membrane protein YhaH (DUF805 family)
MNWVVRRLHPSGRTSRVGYWRWQAVLVAGMGGVLLGTVLVVDTGGPGLAPFLLVVPLLIVTVLVAIRRMHDRNRSGWWVLLFSAAPFFPAGLADALAPMRTTDGSLAALALLLAAMALYVWALLEFGFLRGTRGPNRFGPEPQSR